MDEMDTLLEFAVKKAIQENPAQKEPPWSEAEISFLHENHARLLDHEIAKALGRTEMAVKIYRVRQGLPAASRAKTDWVTSNEASKMLGIEIHSITWWCDIGMIPHTMAGPNRFIRLVRMRDLTAFAVNPDNWVYFDWRRIKDERLRRLCELRAARWGDEWWTTRQVAQYHQVDVKDVTRLIWHKRIDAYCPPVSRGGRHPIRRWAYWFVRKSVAVNVKFLHHGDDMARFTPRGDAWVLKARDELHMPYNAIGRTMGSRRKGTRGKTGTTIKNRYEYLMGMIGMAEDWAYSLRYGG